LELTNLELTKKFKAYVRRCARAPKPKYSLPPGFSIMEDFQPQDVFIAAYPKSGNTWMQVIVAALSYGVSPLQCPDSVVQELVPDIHQKRVYKRFLPQMTFKTHHLPRPEYKKVISLVRDGRDVLVSYFHYLRALGRAADYERLATRGDVFGPWHEHVLRWKANPFEADVLVVRYEDLLSSPEVEIQRVSAFIGSHATAERIRDIAKETEFSIMQDREKKFGIDNPEWPKDKPFFREGRAKQFEKACDPAMLTRFTALSGAALQAYGYD
jgi:hypothetical protein